MLTVNSISKSYGIEKILDRVSFILNPGDRIGLVGPNGCGKTTLLRILIGEERVDSGSVQFSPPDLAIGYLPQSLSTNPSQTIQDYINRLDGDLPNLLIQLEELSSLLESDPDNKVNQHTYNRLIDQIERIPQAGRHSSEVLSALGLARIPGETRISNLSGGQKTRLALAGVLLSIPQNRAALLLLDEPTNHLDLDMLEWLEDWLLTSSLSHPPGLLLVSHDRALLDNVSTGILAVEPKTHDVHLYPGNYSSYLESKLVELERQRQKYSDYQEEIARLRAAITRINTIARFKRGGKGDSGDKFAKGFFANRTKGTLRRAKHLEHKLDALLTDEKIEKPKPVWQMKLEFDPSQHGSKDVLVFENLSIGYGDNVLLSNLSQTVRHGANIVILGANGTGKTSLLRTIIGTIPALSGRVRVGSTIRMGYMAQEQEDLNPKWDALATILNDTTYSETEARSFLHKFLFSGDDVFIPVGSLSFGERARLSLASLVARGSNLLLLDEPINHLDIPSRTRFEQALAAFEDTVLAVVHDRYFIQGFATEIWEIKDGDMFVQNLA